MVIVAFQPGEKYAVNYTTLDQYDYGQILRIQGLKLPKTVEVHFSTQETGGTSITRVGVTKDGVTDVLIPDSVLENGDTTQNYSIFAFVYITDATSGKTEYRAKLEVKARPKPEVPGGGDNPDIFHEAVLEVRKSAEKAEEAQKQAEGWAHGREDLPERAEDNAMYYAGKASEDAKKTAQDRVEVERLVESVSGIGEQVTKVEKLSKDAQEAATQAETHRQATETASSAAQTAAQETETDRTAVEKAKTDVESLSTQVQKNKESVDKTAEDFNLTAQQALADVNNAGQAQTERVQTAGTTAVENIENAQGTATGAVETAKSEAVKVVEDKGKEVLESIPNLDAKLDKKLDKNLGAEHAGKALVIGEDGNVVPGEVQTEGVGDVADAIVNTATGDLLVIKDSTGRKNKGFEMTGKTEQVSTTGKNLFLHGIELGTYSAQTPDKAESDNTRCRITEPIKINEGFNGIISIFGNYQMYVRTFKNNQLVAESGFLNSYKLDNTLNKIDLITAVIRKTNNNVFNNSEIKQIKIQLEKGSAATAYEPYTGGKPSPSPEYPQEIMNAGRYNEGTGKYSVDVKVNGANLLNEDHFFDMGNWKNGKYYMNLKPDTKYTFSRKDNSGVGSGLFLSVKNTVEGVLTQIVNSNSASSCKQRVTFTTNDSGEIYFDLQNNNKLNLKDFLGFGQLEVGIAATPYEPYKEQTITLTSDRPITKWDKLVEQDGQIGWLYETKKVTIGTNLEWFSSNSPSNLYFSTTIADAYGGKNASFCRTYKNINDTAWIEKYANYYGIYGDHSNIGTGDKCFRPPNETITTLEQWKQWLNENPLEIVYHTKSSQFVHLPQSEQNAIRALQTYYPTTVVSNSEDAEMQLTYVADTKNYTDNKIKEAVSAQTQSLANLLSLMPLSTQAALIENDTNNILDMEVQK